MSKQTTIMARMTTGTKEIITIETIIREVAPAIITIFLIGSRNEVVTKLMIRWTEIITTITITMVAMIRMAAVATGTKTTTTIKALWTTRDREEMTDQKVAIQEWLKTIADSKTNPGCNIHRSHTVEWITGVARLVATPKCTITITKWIMGTTTSKITLKPTQTTTTTIIKVTNNLSMAKHSRIKRLSGWRRPTNLKTKRNSESVSRGSDQLRKPFKNNQVQVDFQTTKLIPKIHRTKRRWDAVTGPAAGFQTRSVSIFTQLNSANSSLNVNMETNACFYILRRSVSLAKTAPAWTAHTSTLQRINATSNQCRIWWWWANFWCLPWPCKARIWCTRSNLTIRKGIQKIKMWARMDLRTLRVNNRDKPHPFVPCGFLELVLKFIA